MTNKSKSDKNKTSNLSDNELDKVSGGASLGDKGKTGKSKVTSTPKDKTGILAPDSRV